MNELCALMLLVAVPAFAQQKVSGSGLHHRPRLELHQPQLT